jgi:hypothetical protein
MSCTALFRLISHHIHRRLIALRDGDNAVFFLQLLAFLRRAAGQEAADGAVTVLGLQLGSDAEQAEVHGDGKAVELFVAEIVRVGVVHVSQRGQINLHHVVVVPIPEGAQGPMVAVGEGFNNLFASDRFSSADCGAVEVVGAATGLLFLGFLPRLGFASYSWRYS